jgi:hypothetical protein
MGGFMAKEDVDLYIKGLLDLEVLRPMSDEDEDNYLDKLDEIWYRMTSAEIDLAKKGLAAIRQSRKVDEVSGE